jgi:Tfp pilus assembly protein PilO
MKLSNREMMLAWVTAVTLVVGFTFWLGYSKYQEMNKTREDARALARTLKRLQKTVDSKPEWEARFGEELSRLPRHPEGKDVTAELLKTLEQMASDHGLILVRREPKPEKSIGDLYEVAINCTWEANLKALTHFLYAVHEKGVILDVRQLSVAPVTGQPGKLKGGFVVDCAYTRVSPEELSSAE